VSAETRVVSSRSALRSAYSAVAAGERRAVVMTMGALHDGHAHLMREARARVGPGGHVTVTVFLNPTQFGAHEDLERYPRTLEADVELCAREGVDLVFAPGPDAVYRDGDPQVMVDPGPLGTVLEGAVRPGHFRGVLTVVLKLLHLTTPHVALFGEKDYQQLVLLRRMVRELDVPVEVVGVPTVRSADGLALSSRNAYLDDAARHAALAIPRALELGAFAARSGGSARDVVSAAQAHLDEEGLLVDYVALTDPWLDAPPPAGEARLLVAARVGEVRLIDNARVDLVEPA
jgi:pantoate--beta-alanine ligase